ncbi:MAG: hypothetical protein CBC34_019175 [Hyphomicrobiaceae bacterium TMED74]|nr:MAG: hypothetical protein CBC34_019175 [Hyphomicrobiaceae bacterium TMED74]
MADDFESATRSAAFGGNTLVMPFCLQEKGQSLREVVSAYHKLADGKCHVDVSFYVITPTRRQQYLASNRRRCQWINPIHRSTSS